MSSSDSDNDEDYVPPEEEDYSSHSNSEDEAADQDLPDQEKQRVRGKNGQPDAGDADAGQDHQKTEDELWKEFLGAESNNQKAEVPKRTPTKDVSTVAISSATAPAMGSAPSNTRVTATELFDSPSVDERSSTGKTDANNGINDGSKAATDTYAQAKPASEKPLSKSGASSLLERLTKEKKVTTLEKSRKEWETYKDNEGLKEELSTHNRGKEGFLEKKEFLERTDYRQFEKERDIRLSRKRKSPLD